MTFRELQDFNFHASSSIHVRVPSSNLFQVQHKEQREQRSRSCLGSTERVPTVLCCLGVGTCLAQRSTAGPQQLDKTVSSQFTARLSWLVLLAQSLAFTESRTPDLQRRSAELRTPGFRLHSYGYNSIISTWKEPIPGWIDNMNGPTMGIMGCSMGMIRCGHLDTDKICDIVPVDTVVNALIATAWETSFRGRGEAKVYNFVSGIQQPITWGEYFDICKEYAVRNPPSRAIWYYFVIFCRNKYTYLATSFLLEFIPACLMDLIPFLTTGKHKQLNHEAVLRWLRDNHGEKEVPQGSPLSPTLFNLAIDGIIKDLTDNEVSHVHGFSSDPTLDNLSAVAFADDIALISSSENGITSLISLAESNLSTLGLAINPSECNLIAIKSGVLSQFNVMSANGSLVQSISNPNDRIKYLGINFNDEIVFDKCAVFTTFSKNISKLCLSPLLKPDQKANSWVSNRKGLFSSEWTNALKMSSNISAVRAIPGRTVSTTRCRHPDCSELETLGHVLGQCPKGELLINARHHRVRHALAISLKTLNWEIHEEVHCVSSDGSFRRADIIAINGRLKRALVLDPTIRFERNLNQATEVDTEKKSIYEPCLPYLSQKYNVPLKQWSVIGLLFGSRGKIVPGPLAKRTNALPTEYPGTLPDTNSIEFLSSSVGKTLVRLAKGSGVDGIDDSEMIFREMRQRIRHRLPDIRLRVGKNLGKNPTRLSAHLGIEPTPSATPDQQANALPPELHQRP
ncbi:hypothetical protein ANN_11864 [Periplaneta americana]|uniref:Fatty acyl-CoA reductase n=1 Tax=Periplaneta americana TaxID=6978 RepID=A0ABQ8T679_PERAM|nr:hypothetical protein ANN_11864 [Periplaneta americana]